MILIGRGCSMELGKRSLECTREVVVKPYGYGYRTYGLESCGLVNVFWLVNMSWCELSNRTSCGLRQVKKKPFLVGSNANGSTIALYSIGQKHQQWKQHRRIYAEDCKMSWCERVNGMNLLKKNWLWAVQNGADLNI